MKLYKSFELLAYSAILLTCMVDLRGEAGGTQELVSKETRGIVDQIRNCPCWLDVESKDFENRDKIRKIYFALAEVNHVILEESIRVYLAEFQGKGESGFKAEAKIFALLRVVYNVPVGFIQNGRIFGSWGNPVKGDSVNLLWPFDAQLLLVGRGGNYYGAPYNALGDLTYLKATFGYRNGQANDVGPSKK